MQFSCPFTLLDMNSAEISSLSFVDHTKTIVKSYKLKPVIKISVGLCLRISKICGADFANVGRNLNQPLLVLLVYGSSICFPTYFTAICYLWKHLMTVLLCLKPKVVKL